MLLPESRWLKSDPLHPADSAASAPPALGTSRLGALAPLRTAPLTAPSSTARAHFAAAVALERPLRARLPPAEEQTGSIERRLAEENGRAGSSRIFAPPKGGRRLLQTPGGRTRRAAGRPVSGLPVAVSGGRSGRVEALRTRGGARRLGSRLPSALQVAFSDFENNGEKLSPESYSNC